MFQKGKERRQNRRAARQDRRADRKDAKAEKRANRNKNAAIGVAIGGAVAATAAGVSAYKKNKAKKAAEAQGLQSEAAAYNTDDYTSESSVETDDEFEIKHPSEYTVVDVKYFLMAIGLEKYCDCFEEKQIDGKVMIKMTKVELERDCGMTSIEIKKFYAAIEFSYEIAEGSREPETPECKPPQQWSEVEVRLVLVAIGVGAKVEEFKKNQVNGAVIVQMTTVEIERECGMTTVEVQKLQAVLVKTQTSGGCGIEPEVDTMPIEQPNLESNSGPNTGAIIGGVVGGAILVGGIGYWAWKKNQDKEEEVIVEEEKAEEIPPPKEEGSSGGCEPPPPCKPPCDFTQIEVKFFLIAIGLESKVPAFEENQIDGKIMVELTKTELEVDLGCSSIEIRKFTAALEFSIEVSEGCQKPDPPCKPPQNWSEVEVCIVLVMIGMGQKVEEVKKCQISGAMAVSMTKVELEQECGMTSIEVKKFKAVAVKR